MDETRKELEERLVELRSEYQEALSDNRNLEDPQFQNGSIDPSQVRLNALQTEIKQIEKKLNELEE